MTAAAITYSSEVVPSELTAALSRAIDTAAATPTRRPMTAKVLTTVAPDFTPARLAASGLPPMANT